MNQSNEITPSFPDEERRLEELQRYAVLDTLPDEALDDVAALAARICETPVALVSLVDEHRQWFKARVGLDLDEVPRELSFCAHALRQTDLLIVPDATRDYRFAMNPLVTGKQNIRFYAGAPLITKQGAVLGTLCVIDHVPRGLTEAQQQSLLVLSKHVMTHLELLRQGRELRASETKLRAIFEAEPECVKLLGSDATLYEINTAGLGIIEADSLESLPDRNVLPLIVPEHRGALRTMLEAVVRGEKRTLQFELIGLQGTLRWLEMTGVPFRDEITGEVFVLGVSHDITARKHADEKIQRLNRFNSVSSNINEAILRIQDTRELYETACRIAVEKGGLLMAWVGLLDPDGPFLLPIASHGMVAGYLDGIRISVNPELQGLGPSGRAFRDDQFAICNDIATDPSVVPWREEALKRGYRSSAAFPLRLAGRPFGVFSVYGDQTGLFDVKESALLNTLAENISFAVEAHQRDQRRIQAESSLRASEQQFSSAFHFAAIGVALVSPEGRFLKVNRALCQMLGYSESDLLALDFQIITHPEDLEADIDQAHRLLAGTIESYQMEKRYFHRLGHLVWAFLSVSLLRDESGIPVQFISQIQDITERKRTEAESQRANDLLRAVADGTPDAIFVKDLQGRYLLVNKAGVRFVRLPIEEILGKDDAAIFAESDARIVKESDRLVMESKKPQTTEEVLTAGGETRIYLATKAPYHDSQGNMIGLIGISRDITERKRSEDRIAEQAALIDAARDAILVRNLKHQVVFWSQGAERIYGWTAAEAVGRQIKELLQPDSSVFHHAYSAVLLEGTWSGEIVKVTKAGTPLTIECRWTLLRDNNDRPKSILEIGTDITERKSIEQQFLRAQRMESIGTLAGGIAHDLNNTLSPIIMAVDLLKMQFPQPSGQELISVIRSSAERGADMVRQLLSFARGVEGRRVQVQIQHLIRDLERLAKDTFLKHVSVNVFASQDLWTVAGDPTQLHQVLLNLFVNARDAMPSGGTLNILAENIIFDAHDAALILEAKPGAYVHIQVEDNGEGMSAETMDKIFDPFFTTKEVGVGTGLGLSTTLAIVKSHRGFLRVASTPGRGTKFEVFIPAESQSPADPVSEAYTEMPRGNGELVLVVDDEAAVRNITRETLEAFGYCVIDASGGAEAVAIYASRSCEIDVVLTDMMMPAMSGAETIRNLRELNPNGCIIATSGLSIHEDVTILSLMGVDRILSKPFTSKTLLGALREALLEHTEGSGARPKTR